jgi:molybdopterin-guanine dinucleotide biosynthesis protein A
LKQSSSGIILSGGESRRLGTDKGLINVDRKPLIQYVLDVIAPLVDEIIVVVKTQEQGARIRVACKGNFVIVLDESEIACPLNGVFAGTKKARGEISLLLACDMPLLSKDVLSLLLCLCSSHGAVIPRWPNGYIEPLHASYNTFKVYEATAQAIDAKELRMYDAIKRLSKVRYISTEILKQLNYDLNTFENVNTQSDLKRVKNLLRLRHH